MKQWKYIAVSCVFLLAGAAIIGRLVFLQVINQGFYKAFAQGQQNTAGLQKGDRGTIYATDRDGNLYALAANREMQYVFATPPEIQNKEETAKAISGALSLDEASVLKKLQNEESLYEVLKKEVTKEEAEQIQELGIKGVYVGTRKARFYPQDTMASQVIGFTNQEGEGQYGIEEQYNDILKGKEGMVKNSRNPASFLLFGSNNQPENGNDIVLTLDYNIQGTAETLLANAKESLGFEEGTIIVMEPSTGKILALANNPSFNPNEYGKANPEVFQNSAIQKIFEPGSIFKPITMAAAIDTGSVTPDTAYTDKGILKVGGYTVYNYDQRTWGERTMKQVLEFSINTGVAFAESQMGHQNFLRYIERFGFFEPTRVDLPGEVYSQNKAFKQGYEINFTTASFGQGIEMTPMQITRALSAILNNGVMPDIFIADNTVDSRGAITTLHPPADGAKRTVISQKTASQITDMLVGVVEEGYGKKAKMPGYYTAGKTGTAQVSWSSLGVQKAGYSDKTIQSFMGYAPAFNPKFFILVKLNDPKTNTAEYSALPIFSKLQKYIIDYYQIPPDYEP